MGSEVRSQSKNGRPLGFVGFKEYDILAASR